MQQEIIPQGYSELVPNMAQPAQPHVSLLSLAVLHGFFPAFGLSTTLLGPSSWFCWLQDDEQQERMKEVWHNLACLTAKG